MPIDQQPRMYTELAHWWPLLSPPSHYVEEAADLLPDIQRSADSPPRTLLELGCGGGSLAFHLKDHLELTLTDRSAAMLDVCRSTNPECVHAIGDMRTLELDRQFDVVLIHDAIMHMTDRASLRTALGTAGRHCRPGGGLVLVPDCVRETFRPYAKHGGEDAADGRGLRYLEWVTDADPADELAETAYAFLLREADGAISTASDFQVHGLFPLATWIECIREAGFSARSRMDRWDRHVFVGRKGAG